MIDLKDSKTMVSRMCYSVDVCPLCKSTDVYLKAAFKEGPEDIAIYDCSCGCRFCISFQILETPSDNQDEDDD